MSPLAEAVLHEVLRQRIWLPLPKPTDGGFGRSAIGKEGRFIFRVSVYSGENKVPLLPRWMEMFQCNQPARQRVMDGPLGYVAIRGVHCSAGLVAVDVCKLYDTPPIKRWIL